MSEIHLGIPEMEELWNRLEKKHQSGSATFDFVYDRQIRNKWRNHVKRL